MAYAPDDQSGGEGNFFASITSYSRFLAEAHRRGIDIEFLNSRNYSPTNRAESLLAAIQKAAHGSASVVIMRTHGLPHLSRSLSDYGRYDAAEDNDSVLDLTDETREGSLPSEMRSSLEFVTTLKASELDRAVKSAGAQGWILEACFGFPKSVREGEAQRAGLAVASPAKPLQTIGEKDTNTFYSTLSEGLPKGALTFANGKSVFVALRDSPGEILYHGKVARPCWAPGDKHREELFQPDTVYSIRRLQLETKASREATRLALEEQPFLGLYNLQCSPAGNWQLSLNRRDQYWIENIPSALDRPTWQLRPEWGADPNPILTWRDCEKIERGIALEKRKDIALSDLRGACTVANEALAILRAAGVDVSATEKIGFKHY